MMFRIVLYYYYHDDYNLDPAQTCFAVGGIHPILSQTPNIPNTKTLFLPPPLSHRIQGLPPKPLIQFMLERLLSFFPDDAAAPKMLWRCCLCDAAAVVDCLRLEVVVVELLRVVGAEKAARMRASDILVVGVVVWIGGM